MNKYQFTIAKLTIRDYALMVRAANTSDVFGFLEIVAKAADCDIWTLPANQMNAVCAQFTAALQVFIEAQQEAETPDAMNILKRVFGDKASE